MINPNDKKHHDSLKRLANLFLGCDEFQKQLENLISQLDISVRQAKLLGNAIKREIDSLVKINGGVKK